MPRRAFDDGDQRQASETRPPSPAPPPNEQEVLSLIHKGGSVAKPADTGERDAAKPMLVQLRLYPDMIEEIDGVRQKHGGEKAPHRRRGMPGSSKPSRKS